MQKKDWIVLGYHGTTKDRADAIFDSGFKIKANEYDWLGSGVYFFERAPLRAHSWAVEHHPDSEVCVVVAEIALAEHCLDLSDLDGVATLESYFKLYLETFGTEHAASLKETFGNRELTCAVINWCCRRMAENGWDVYALRAPFEEGEPLFSHPLGNPTARSKKLSHVQIAVRDCSVIRDFWLDDKIAAKG